VNDIGIHLLLFAVIGAGIMTMAAFYSEPVDSPALRSIPRRLVVFAIGCGILAALMILAEYTVASVN